jgi:hypothetical protein
MKQSLKDLLSRADCVIHTAGPYIDCRPAVLEAAIESKVPVYIDVGDPLSYLSQGKLLSGDAVSASTTALIAAGAFPGMSNVLGMETADAVKKASGKPSIQNIFFNYFTAGLGGSGAINLFITNVGFGEPISLFDRGSLQFFTELSGELLGNVDFFLENVTVGFGNEMAKERVGTKQVFAWPFPEGATVPLVLQARGSSSVAMGTAPEIWNSILGILVSVIPRSWWRNYRFSQFMADFSRPLVFLTDWWMKWGDPMKIGETHAMRIDVNSDDGSIKMATIQAHDSFRQCVGQSCAEFALDCLDYPTPGVYFPEERYHDETPRQRIIGKLTSTPGTFCYTGPVKISHAITHCSEMRHSQCDIKNSPDKEIT